MNYESYLIFLKFIFTIQSFDILDMSHQSMILWLQILNALFSLTDLVYFAQFSQLNLLK